MMEGNKIVVFGIAFIFLLSFQALATDVTLSPQYVDTSVTNQTLQFAISSDRYVNITFDEIKIELPDGYPIVAVSLIESEEEILYDLANNVTNVTVTIDTTELVITNNTEDQFSGDNGIITIDLLVNTNSTEIDTTSFDVTLSGMNLTDSSAYSEVTEIDITTKQLIDVISVETTKGTAILSGSDYWEFKFYLNITANVTGKLQYWMSNWTTTVNGEHHSLNLTNGGCYCSFNGTQIENEYIMDWGQTNTYTTEKTYEFVLRMVIPSTAPVSPLWSAYYNMLFRVEP